MDTQTMSRVEQIDLATFQPGFFGANWAQMDTISKVAFFLETVVPVGKVKIETFANGSWATLVGSAAKTYTLSDGTESVEYEKALGEAPVSCLKRALEEQYASDKKAIFKYVTKNGKEEPIENIRPPEEWLRVRDGVFGGGISLDRYGDWETLRGTDLSETYLHTTEYAERIGRAVFLRELLTINKLRGQEFMEARKNPAKQADMITEWAAKAPSKIRVSFDAEWLAEMRAKVSAKAPEGFRVASEAAKAHKEGRLADWAAQFGGKRAAAPAPAQEVREVVKEVVREVNPYKTEAFELALFRAQRGDPEKTAKVNEVLSKLTEIEAILQQLGIKV